jgi:hypothetical protein
MHYDWLLVCLPETVDLFADSIRLGEAVVVSCLRLTVVCELRVSFNVAFMANE